MLNKFPRLFALTLSLPLFTFEFVSFTPSLLSYFFHLPRPAIDDDADERARPHTPRPIHQRTTPQDIIGILLLPFLPPPPRPRQQRQPSSLALSWAVPALPSTPPGSSHHTPPFRLPTLPLTALATRAPKGERRVQVQPPPHQQQLLQEQHQPQQHLASSARLARLAHLAPGQRPLQQR